jgi:predicted GH43/DUF377 family glycosyl hydrolase
MSHFPCIYRGDELGTLDCRCRGQEKVFACAHPENPAPAATRFDTRVCCTPNEALLPAGAWNCTECIVRRRISIRTGRPPDEAELKKLAWPKRAPEARSQEPGVRSQESRVRGQEPGSIATHHLPLAAPAPPAPPGGRRLTQAAQRRLLARQGERPAGELRLAQIGPAALEPLWRTRIDPAALLAAEHQFNCSLVAHRGRRFFSYRRHWTGARLVLAELDEHWRVLWNRELAIRPTPHNELAQEDPRLFIFRGALHVAYSGVFRNRQGAVRTSVCVARLSEEGAVAADWYAHYEPRQSWEKNWSFFEHAGGLYCVYSIAPHRILRVQGSGFGVHDHSPLTSHLSPLTAVFAHESAAPEFAGGAPRGGASPVLHDGQWYSFFHSVLGDGRDRVYAMGLYTFEDRPPFRITRFLRQPLLLPRLADRPAEHTPHSVYPAGALFDRQRGQWVISFGYYDRFSELAAFDAARLEELLTPWEA